MPWIKTVPEEKAEGPLRRIYESAIKRAGRVFNIVKVMSLNPDQLRASMDLYMKTTTSPDSALPRATREMLAVVVSQANQCHY